MDENNEPLFLGKGSPFVKSRLSRLPRTDETWEADIQPISVRGWNTRRHGDLWLGMVLTQCENLHLAVLTIDDVPSVNDLATLLAKAMEQPWVMKPRRPSHIILRDNPQWEELIAHLRQLKIEVKTQHELPLWDEAAAAYVRKLRARRRGQEVPVITVQQHLDERFPAVSEWMKSLGRIEIGLGDERRFMVRAVEHEEVIFEATHVVNLDEALIALEQAIVLRRG